MREWLRFGLYLAQSLPFCNRYPFEANVSYCQFSRTIPAAHSAHNISFLLNAGIGVTTLLVKLPNTRKKMVA